MKHKIKILVLASIGISLTSCEPEIKNNDLFDLKGLIEDQQELLEELNPSVTRISNLNGKKDTVALDSIDWEEELEPLTALDLNNSKYRDDYEISEGSDQGLSFIQYQMAPDKKFTGVKTLTIYYSTALTSPTKIEIEQIASNMVYESFNDYILHLKDNKIRRMEVSGHQDLMLKDKVEYEVVTVVRQ